MLICSGGVRLRKWIIFIFFFCNWSYKVTIFKGSYWRFRGLFNSRFRSLFNLFRLASPILKCFKNLYQNWFVLRCLRSTASLFGKSISVFSFTLEIDFWVEDSQRVVKAVKLHKFSDNFSTKSRLRIFSEFLGKRILPMEITASRLNLVLLIDRFKHTWSQLSSHLSKNTICLKWLYHKIL